MPDRLSPLDVSFLYLEEPTTAMHVGSVMIFDPPGPGFSYERMVRHVAARIAFVPRYRQRVRWVPAHLANPVWVDDEDFDITYHVRRSALPRPGSTTQLQELVARLQSRPLDRARPLWELILVEGLQQGRVAVVTKVHQALVDGVQAVDLGQVVLDDLVDAHDPPPQTWHPTPEPSAVELLVSAVADSIRRPQRVVETVRSGVGDVRATAGKTVDALGGLVLAARTATRSTPRSPLNVDIGQHRRFVMVATDLADYRKIRNHSMAGPTRRRRRLGVGGGGAAGAGDAVIALDAARAAAERADEQVTGRAGGRGTGVNGLGSDPRGTVAGAGSAAGSPGSPGSPAPGSDPGSGAPGSGGAGSGAPSSANGATGAPAPGPSAGPVGPLVTTVNDVVLATITGALRTWLLTRGEPVATGNVVRALVPMSVRANDPREAGAIGSRVASLLVDLPTGEASPLMRLHQISFQTKAHREGGQAVDAPAIAGIAGFAPPTLHSLGARLASGLSRRMFNLVITNVPGPQQPLYLDGVRMLSSYPVIPLARGQAVSIGLTSYDGGVYYGLNGDRDAMPDLDVLGQCIVDSLAEMLEMIR